MRVLVLIFALAARSAAAFSSQQQQPLRERRKSCAAVWAAKPHRRDLLLSGAGAAAAGLTTAMTPLGAVGAEEGQDEGIFAFQVPLRGKEVPLRKFGGKAQLVVNIKMDDPLCGSNLDSLRYLTNKYSSQGLRVWAFPTDQGYFEPDVAEIIRAKAYQQFGFGQYPAAVVFDKVDVLGKFAHPLYKYLEATSSNPNGVQRLTLNFEKFLLDQDGKVLRRYPRKFSGYDIEDDVKTLIDGKPLPPQSPEFDEAWAKAATEAQKGEYSFRLNYNVYDQSMGNTDWAGLADLSFQ